MHIVIKATNKENTEQFVYYRITKCSGEVADVTEYYQHEEPTTVANPDTPTSMRDTMNELGIKGLHE